MGASEDLLLWVLNKALVGFAGFVGAGEMAAHAKQSRLSLDKRVGDLIYRACMDTGMAGFAANLGGIVASLAAMPADILFSLFQGARLALAIASLYNHDIYDKGVQAFALACSCGKSFMNELSKDMGVMFSRRLLTSVTGRTLTKINQAVGYRFITKAGTTGTINIVKWLPLVGGVVGGTVNAMGSRAAGEAADIFFAN
jgi:hypothetical protein